MRFPRRDRIATLYVAVAMVAYGAWLAATDHPTEMSIRVMAGVLMALGFAASATAVVPGFEELMHASKIYLVIASLIGLAACVAGLVALVRADETMLVVLATCTAVLWVMATVRHGQRTEAVHRAPAGGASRTPRNERARVPIDRPPR
jgi:hypothetical protein